MSKNGIEPSAVNIDALIELLEPVIDERDYLGELDDIEAMDIDTENEDYLGCGC